MRKLTMDWFKARPYEVIKITNKKALEMRKKCLTKPVETDIIKMKKVVNK